MVGLGYRVTRARRSSTTTTTSPRSTTRPGHPARMLQDTFYVQSHPEVLLRTHTSPMQVRSMEAQPPPIFIDRPRQGLPARLRRHPQPDVPPGRGAGDRRGDHPRRPAGDAAGDAAGRSSAPSREVRLRPHFFPFTEPSVEVDVSCFQCDGTGALAGGERCNLCKGSGWIEIVGAGMVDPNVLGFVEAQRLRPRAGAGLRLRHGGRADRDAAPRRPRPAALLRQRRADAGAVLMRVPLLMAARVLRSRRRAGGAGRAAGDDRDRGRAGRHGRAALGRGLRRRQGARAPSRTPTPTGCASARSTPATASGRSSAAPPTSPPARPSPWRCPGRAMPGGDEARARRSCAGSSRTG